MKVKQFLLSIAFIGSLSYCAYTFIPAFISTLTYHATTTDKQVLQAFNNMQGFFSIIFGLISLLIVAGIIFGLYVLIDSFHPLPTKETKE